jgi:uncharacterized membrane protein
MTSQHVDQCSTNAKKETSNHIYKTWNTQPNNVVVFVAVAVVVIVLVVVVLVIAFIFVCFIVSFLVLCLALGLVLDVVLIRLRHSQRD